MRKKVLLLLCMLLVFTLFLFACSGVSDENNSDNQEDESNNDEIIVAFSQCQSGDPWRIAQINDIKRAAKEYGYNLIYTDAGGDTAQQIEDVKYICEQIGRAHV